MKRKNNVIYINGSTLKNMANYGFGGNKGLAKSWLKRKYSGRTIRFLDTWGVSC